MSGPWRFMAFVGWLAVAGVAAGLVWAAVGDVSAVAAFPGDLAAMNARMAFKAAAIAAAALLAILDLAVLVSPILFRREEKSITFASSSGEMVIEVSALEDCLRRILLNDPAVGDAEVSIDVPEPKKAGAIVCRLSLGIFEQSNVPQKADEVTLAAKKHFLDVLPMPTEPAMKLSVRILRPPKSRGPHRVSEAASSDLENDAAGRATLGGGLIYGSSADEERHGGKSD